MFPLFIQTVFVVIHILYLVLSYSSYFLDAGASLVVALSREGCVYVHLW